MIINKTKSKIIVKDIKDLDDHKIDELFNVDKRLDKGNYEVLGVPLEIQNI